MPFPITSMRISLLCRFNRTFENHIFTGLLTFLLLSKVEAEARVKAINLLLVIIKTGLLISVLAFTAHYVCHQDNNYCMIKCACSNIGQMFEKTKNETVFFF